MAVGPRATDECLARRTEQVHIVAHSHRARIRARLIMLNASRAAVVVVGQAGRMKAGRLVQAVVQQVAAGQVAEAAVERESERVARTCECCSGYP